MVKVKPNLWLDKTPAREKASVSQNSGTGSWVTGVVREVLDGGLLRVGVPADDPVSEAVVPSDGTVSAVGAVVRVMVDARGRGVHVGAPVSVPEGADLVPSGAVGRWVADGRAQVDAAMADLTEQTAVAAEAAQVAANTAEVAQNLAESKTSVTRGAGAPAAPGVGDVWLRENAAGNVETILSWDGTVWGPLRLAAGEIVVPGTVGAVHIADGAVTAPKVVVSEELWAKIASFAKVTTEMLVAGDATIAGTAVVGDLVGNTLRGGVLSLLDQAQTPSTATGSNTAGAWRYAPDGVMSGNTTGSVSTVSGYPVVTINSGTTPGGFFTASMQYGEVFGPAAAVGAITYSVTVKVAGGSGPISFSVQSNEATTYSSGFVNAVSGGTYTLRATIPEGQWLNQQSGSLFNRILIKLGAGFSQGTTFTITSITASWPPALKTGLKIYRDSTGQARIDVVGDDGNTAILNSSGVTMKDASGATIGTTTWRNLVAPPIAISYDSTGGAGLSVPAGRWSTVPVTKNLKTSGGIVASGGGFVVPVSGWYVLTGKVLARASGDQMIGVMVSANGADTVFSYARYVLTSWTWATTTGVRYLSAGDKVDLRAQSLLSPAASAPIGGYELSIQYVTD